METRLKVAIVGTGAIASERHIPIWLRMPEAKIVAVCDLNKEVAERVSEQFGIPNVYTDIEAMLVQESPEIVDLCTPPQTHASLALKAIKHGSHVIMEKPMALRTEDCRTIVEAARNRNVKVCVIHQMLFYPPILKARQMIEQGSIGEFLGMRIFIANPVWLRTAEEKDWVHRLPGGIIGETGPHLVYLSQAFIGEIREVSVNARKHTPYPWCPFDDYRIELIGKRGTSSITALYASEQFAGEVDIYGTEGFLKADLQSMTLISYERKYRRSWVILQSSLQQAFGIIKGAAANVVRAGIGQLRPGFAHEAVIRGFLKAVITGGAVPVSGEEGMATVEIMEKIASAL